MTRIGRRAWPEPPLERRGSCASRRWPARLDRKAFDVHLHASRPSNKCAE
jgi:hypothetical protein